MDLQGILHQKTYRIHIEQRDEHHFTVSIDGRTYELNCIELMPHLYSLLDGDHSNEVRVHKLAKNDRYETHFLSETLVVEMTDPMKHLLDEHASAGGGGEATLEAAMPGKVQRILVKEGDRVEEDQGLLVLVAMKMENELGSPKAGTVKKILVKEGESVEGGAPLAVVG